MNGTAIIDHPYRYLLTRSWGEGPTVLWVMLNPSVANALKNDLTIKKCIGYTMNWGYYGLAVVNLFAKISTDPQCLNDHPDPVGPLNDKYIIEAATDPKCEKIVFAWGCDPHLWNRKVLADRPYYIESLFPDKDIWCLGKTTKGSPKHPSRLAYSTPLELFRAKTQ